MILHVSVTQEDIDLGVRRDAKRCAGALAIKRAFDAAGLVFGGLCPAHVHLDVVGPEVPVPNAMTVFIDAFDIGKPVQPFEFDLKVPA